eukprot:5724380-Amphidinium_carterae.1
MSQGAVLPLLDAFHGKDVKFISSAHEQCSGDLSSRAPSRQYPQAFSINRIRTASSSKIARAESKANVLYRSLLDFIDLLSIESDKDHSEHEAQRIQSYLLRSVSGCNACAKQSGLHASHNVVQLAAGRACRCSFC